MFKNKAHILQLFANITFCSLNYKRDSIQLRQKNLPKNAIVKMIKVFFVNDFIFKTLIYYKHR